MVINMIFKHLTELMRWLTFSSSSLKMIQFFNEDVIPILLEYDHQLSIGRLIKAYQDLFIAILKAWFHFVKMALRNIIASMVLCNNIIN